jgi:hypothetical protein
MQGEGADGLLVVGERADSFALSDVPETDGAIVRSRDDLGIIRVRSQGANSVRVPRQTVHLSLGADVPELFKVETKRTNGVSK